MFQVGLCILCCNANLQRCASGALVLMCSKQNTKRETLSLQAHMVLPQHST